MKKSAAIQNLHVVFQEKTRCLTAVDGIDFELYPGETLALLGESGCGKSLTALALMRLLPKPAVYGASSRVLIDEDDILDLPEMMMRSFRGKRLAMIFQEPMTALNPVLTIGTQLKEALIEHQSIPKHELQERLVQLLTEVELPEPERRLRQYPHQLSGGQKQRVVIAMALACKPDILIADEPTTALDVTIQAQILSLLKQLQCQRQMSLLLITHDLGVVKAVASRVCVMYAGQIVETATTQEFFSQPHHPYSQQLLAAMPSLAWRDHPLHSIDGQVPALEQMPQGCRFHPRCAHAFEPCTHVAPGLQSLDEAQVRCHLYPGHTSLPELTLTETTWKSTEKKTELILSVRHVSVDYPLEQGFSRQGKQVFHAVDDVSFDVYQGKTLALVGESGCGKTTTARAILRVLPITHGELLFQGDSIPNMHGARLRAFRRQVQMIFQDPYAAMNPRMTVNDILAEGMCAQGYSRNTIYKKQLELLEQVRLPRNSLSRYPHQFSGGQRQRITIARALATEPKLLVCDEPTSALDISVQAQILNLLKELQQTYGLSYLFITHNMGVVSYMADDVLVMHRGRVVESGACATVLQSPQAEYTKALLASVLG